MNIIINDVDQTIKLNEPIQAGELAEFIRRNNYWLFTIIWDVVQDSVYSELVIPEVFANQTVT